MAGRTLDVALRIATDLDGAVSDIRKVEDAQKRVELATSGLQRAQAKLAQAQTGGKASADQLAQAQERVTRAELALSGATERLGAITGRVSNIQRQGAISAGQHAQAMRQLPMQITDIVTGLASGQSPFMVAIQQGGQLRDSFGGIAPAASALVGTLNPLTLAVAAGAVAFGTMGAALYQAQQQMEGFDVALARSGLAASITSDELADMADRLDASTDATAGHAAEVIAQVVGTGQIAKDQIELVAAAALQAEASNIQSVDETIAAFVKLGKDPVTAVLALNEAQHFLSDETLAQIRSFQEQGRTADAAAVAFNAYASFIDQGSGQVTTNLGFIETALRGIKNGAKEAFDEIVTGMRRADREASEGLRGFSDLLSRLRVGGPAGAFAAISGMNADATPSTGSGARRTVDSATAQRNDRERKQAEQEWDRLRLSNLSREKKLEEEIKEIKRVGLALGKSDAEIQAQIAQARARYKESLPKPKKGGKSDAQQAEEAAQREIANLQRQADMLGLVADGERQVSAEALARYETEQGAYRLADASTKQRLIDQAKSLDAARKQREEDEKAAKAKEDAARAYERLRDELRTPVESHIDQVTNQIKALNAQLAAGNPIAEGYQATLARILQLAATKAPEVPGQSQRPPGMLGDAVDLAGYQAQLDTWRTNEIAATDAYYALVEGKEVEHQERLAAIQREYGERSTAYHQAQSRFMLGAASSLFGSLAEIARSGAGEQSKTYRALFALSQGFAVAQALIAVYQNAANAMKDTPYPYNIPIIVGAIAQGLGIVAQIRSVSPPSGYATGGYTGPGGKYEPAGIVHRGEGVLSQEDIRALGGPGGFYALRSAIHNGFADGGLVEPVYAANEPSYRMATPGASSGASVNNSMRLYLYQDIDQLRSAILNHPDTDRKIVGTVGDNRGAVEVAWSGG